ncbi:MAG: HDIG domain-containing protein [Prevotella sp.]|nr:HDIG domain-containing protein [Prevotella sp.]MDY5257736.1 HDIG domain-containing protein [Prevotella sp.]
MVKFKYNKSNKWKNLLMLWALVIITVSIIVWFLPRTEGKMFHYDVGKPWMYGQLIAKFDFPVFKTDEALQAERDTVYNSFQPYYNRDQNIEHAEIQKFLNDFSNGMPGIPDSYKGLIVRKLQKIYNIGVIDPREYNNLSKVPGKQIRVVDGKEAHTVSVDSTFSTPGAYEQLFMDEKLGPMRSALQRCNLNNYIEPNLIYDKERSETERNDMLSLIPQADGMVMEGQRIIDRGDMVTSYTYRVLSSFEKAMEQRNASDEEIESTFIGQMVYVFVLVFLFTEYLVLFRKDYFSKPRNITMLYAMIVIYPILVSLMMKHSILSVYILPFAMVPIFIRVFFDSRTAFITHTTMILICAVAVKYQYEFIIVQLVAGLVAIYSLRELSKRSQIFLTALLVTVASAVSYMALQLIQSNNISSLDHTMYFHFAVNGFFLLFAYPLMLVIEKTFGFISTVTLFELSNTNNPLLRKLSEEAPGTFQHSITVGNLASEIANKIGAKSQLVRTGALYHDIGKMEHPVFFTENQSGINPHTRLDAKSSARIIISHVTNGLKIAEQYNLPRVIKDFIATHHGTGLTKYFYITYKNEHPNEDVDPQPFTYPGPNPFTREQAILMMSDAVEAASRSLKEYTEESIARLVNKIIDEQVANGFFEDCPITFRDIKTAKLVLIERLKAMYHTRIQYPELKKEESSRSK